MEISKKPTKPKGKLGILTPGMGAVATTFIAGVEAVRRGYAKPFGSLTQMGTIRLGKRTENRVPRIKDFIPLAELDDLVFGGWDIFEDNAFEAARKAGVLEPALLEKVRPFLETVKPMKAVFDQTYVKRLSGTWVKKAKNWYDHAEQIKEDILAFKEREHCDRLVMVWCASTEIFMKPTDTHRDIESFEKALKARSAEIAPSMVYAYAALSLEKRVPVAGKDFKTGQTLMKTILAPGLKARMLGLNGWYSTNILGNRDGEVLDDPESFKTKEESKLSVLEHILQPNVYPDLYGKFSHVVRINYYPPRGDNKEGWDNIDIFGWLGYPMQIKIDFLCRDSILAAPIVLDLSLFMDLAQRLGMRGIQEWLSFYFKSPMHAAGLYPEHDLFIQLMKLKNTLRYIQGEELITHLGQEYYD
jgi:myo-inositol-1-phosphate synthase